MGSDLSISGLASGVNTADIVDKLMSLERRPLVLMQDQKDKLQKTETAWQGLNTRLLALSTALDNLKKASTFSGKSAVVSDSAVLAVSAGSSASAGTYTIQVKKMAMADSVVANSTPGFDATKTLTSQLAGFQSGNVTIGGKVITVSDTDTLNSFADNINKAQSNIQASVINNRLVLTASQTGSANALSVGTSGNFALADGDTDAGTTDSNVLEGLGVYTGAAFNTYLQHAGDSDSYINGIEVTSGSNTLSSAVNGLSITLKAVSQTVASTGDPVQDLKGTSVQVGVDTQTAVTAVKNFVTQYNAVMSYIEDQTGYNSTTKISGALGGDYSVVMMEQNLRQLVGSAVSGLDPQYNSLAQLGISTSGKDPTLSVDETKLTAALNANPSAVSLVFAPGSGIATVMSTRVKDLTEFGSGFIAGRTDSIDAQIKDLSDRMDDLNDRLTLREENLRARFNAMEQAIQAFKSQGTSLTSMLAALPSFSSSSSSK